MNIQSAYRLDELVDGQRFRVGNLVLLVWSFLATFTDGFEISSLGFAAPHIASEWHVAFKAMAPMMSASLFGMMIGGPLMGYMGDRMGRRPATALGCILFGLTTFAVVGAGNVGEIAILRFLTGIGMGGVMPNVIALNSELSPRRLRARLVVLMFMGITLGAAVPGLVAAWWIPLFGWKVIFFVGGVVAVVVGIAGFFFIPESVKYLAMRPARKAEFRATLAKLRPDLPQLRNENVVIAVPDSTLRGSLLSLFADGLAPITLLIWVCFAMTLMANFFLASWLPALFRDVGHDPKIAALTASTFQFGALFGALTMSMLLDRFGYLAIGLMLLAAAPIMLAAGIPGLSPPLLGLITAFGGFCVLGGQTGSNAAAGIIYPTPCRSRGVGLAFAVGRVGSVLGPILGAHLIGMRLMELLLICVVSPVLLAAISALLLAAITRRRFGAWRLQEIGS